MYLKYLSIMLFMSVFYGISCSAQKQGYVVTNTNDTIKGKFKLEISHGSSAYGAPMVFAVYNLKNAKTNIYIDSIKKIDIVKGEKISDSYIIYDNSIWQMAVAKNDLGIYKRDYKTISTDNNATIYNPVTGNNDANTSLDYATKYEAFAIFSGKTQIVQIYNDVHNYSLIQKDILQFINDRYKVKLTKWKIIKSQQKLFDFILDKEAELEQQGK